MIALSNMDEVPALFGDCSHRLVDFVEGPVLGDMLGVTNVKLWAGLHCVALARLVATHGAAAARHPLRVFRLREVIDMIDRPDLAVLETERAVVG